jgi:hypothetical protein
VGILVNASGERIARTTSLPTYTNMSACGFARRTADGDSYGSIFGIRNTGYTNGSGIFTRRFVDGDNVVLYTSDVGDSLIMARPAIGTWFFWGFTCAGTGAGDTIGYGRLLSSTSLSATGDGDSSVFTFSDMELGSGPAADSFVGELSCVKIWDAVLTSAEMLAESFSVFPKRLNNLHLYSRLETSDTAGLRDLSSNGRDWTDVISGLSNSENAPVRLMRRRAQQYYRAATSFNTKIRQYANGYFQSAQFVEVSGPHAMRMFANGQIQINQMVEQ